ncbi:hypothetical protein ACLMJK_000744 [Lecanora helva]
MAATAPALANGKHLLEESSLPTRKRFKTSELPLNSAQRSAIDGILHTVKKKGEYDTLRKQVWSQFAESAQKAEFTKSLHELAEAEIERDPSLLSRDRGKAATLMQGAVDRSDIYKNVEATLDDLIAKNIDHIIKAGREIRRAEVGETTANEEESRGSKTDEQYDEEIAAKRKERIRVRKQEEARKRREDQKEALRLEEQKKLKELEALRLQDEKRREREALRASREAMKKKPQNMTREELEKEKEQATDKLKPAEDPATESPATPAPPVDEKALEEAALALLLQEGREAAAKNAPKTERERERSESPHRKPHISPPKGPAAMRRDSTKPRLGFSATPMHQGSPIPPPPLSARSGGRSPYHASASHRERSRSSSHTRRRSHSVWEDDSRRDSQANIQPDPKAQNRSKHDAEAESYRSEDDDYYDHRSSKPRERDSTRDRDDYSKRYDYDSKYSRESYHRRRDERSRSRNRDRDGGRYEDRRSSYTRLPREEAPEHIDRYVPGGARPRDRDKDRERGSHRERDKESYRERDSHSHRDKDRDRDRDRDIDERDHRDSRRDRDRDRDRGSYYDTDRERQYYKRDSDRDRRDRDRDRDREREREGYRERDRDRDRRDERRGYKPIRTDEPPEHIDRYVPGK